MTEAEWNKLTERQKATIKEICSLMHDERLYDILAEQLAKERELLPFIRAELNKAKKGDPEINNLTVFDIFEAQNEENARRLDAASSAPGMEIQPKSKAAIILERAVKEAEKQAAKVARANKARKIQLKDAQEQALGPVQKIHYKPITEVNLTTGNFSKSFFALTPNFKTSSDGKTIIEVPFITKDKKEAVLIASVTPNKEYLKENGVNEVEFDPGYDNFVRIICDNLYAAGNSNVTITKFLHEMGQPYSQKEAQKLLTALRKGANTVINANNKEILKLYNKRPKTYRNIESALLPIRFSHDVSMINGNIAETTIEIMGFSPFYQVENPINQITTYDKQVFTLYRGRRTTRYYRVLIYLLNEIAWLRNGGRVNKFLFSSIYKFVGDTTPHEREATQMLVYDLLEQVFLILDYISGYTPPRPDRTKKEKLNDHFKVTYHKDRIPFRNRKEQQKALNAKNQK